MLAQEHDRLPAASLEFCVDTFGFRTHFIQKLLVARNIRATGCADLHESEAPLVCRITFEKQLNAAESFKNTFGIVDAVDADAEQRRLDPQFCAELRAQLAGVLHSARDVGVFGECNADWVRPHAGDMPLAIDGKSIPFR